MDSDIETIAKTIIWLAKEKIKSKSGNQNLISAIYETSLQVNKTVEKKLAELRKVLGKKK